MLSARFFSATTFPGNVIKRPFQLVRYIRIFRDWPAVLKARWQKGAESSRYATYHLRTGCSVTVWPAVDWNLIGEIFISEPYAPSRKLSDPKVIWDIGANIGTFVLWASQYWPTAEYRSFEPCRTTFELLEKNQQNNASLRWSIHHYGISDANETVTTYALRDAPTLTSVHGAEGGEPVELPLRNINDVWREHGCPRIDLLKIDCEGAEYAIFDAVEPELLASVRAIIMEIHPVEGRERDAVRQKLEQNRFSVNWSDDPVATIWAENRAWQQTSSATVLSAER